ncbi:hypothetical protein [Pontibacter sp. BAB1700]|uniref:hypothetical protein n=1 Tax=Pontibacter sp. BAB1700 TaxID=1144253 RepID=UPI00026BCE46|nr:hypothetical protein [Pontibacter sp. BAB1700]EJF08552.1 hypothetical protein O71_20112 [Pontibacter sp. BAB1700]
MNKVLLLILFLSIQQALLAQDIIVKVSGEEIPARVQEITLHDVLYQHPDSSQGVIWRLPKTEVFMVKFENGTKEVFEQHLADSLASMAQGMTPEQLYELGKADAKHYYKGNGAMWGSAASSMVMFPIGLAGSVVIGATAPKVKPERVSDIGLLAEQDYLRGYQEQAARKKRGKALAGVGIGAGIQIGLLILILTSMPVMP